MGVITPTRFIIATLLSLLVVWGVVAQTNPLYSPIGPIFRKLLAMINSTIFLLEQRGFILDAEIAFVTGEPEGSVIPLRSGESVLREDWLAEAGATKAVIDGYLLELR